MPGEIPSVSDRRQQADQLPPHSVTSRPRKINDAPFCWQSKPARRKIRDSFDAEKTVSSALGVYDALTEIASDKESETFQTTHAWIAQKSGLSPRTVQDRITGLAEISLVKVFTPALKSPSTFTLLAVPQPLQSDRQPLPSVRQRTKKAPLRSLEEKDEENPKNGIPESHKLGKSEPANTPKSFLP